MLQLLPGFDLHFNLSFRVQLTFFWAISLYPALDTGPGGIFNDMKYTERTNYENENENYLNLWQFSSIFDILWDFHF